MGTSKTIWTRPLLVALTLIAAGWGVTGLAEDTSEVSLETALADLAARSGLQLAYRTDMIRGVTTRMPPSGLAPKEELAVLLSGTGFEAQEINSHTLTIRRAQKTSSLELDSSLRVADGSVARTGQGEQPDVAD